MDISGCWAGRAMTQPPPATAWAYSTICGGTYRTHDFRVSAIATIQPEHGGFVRIESLARNLCALWRTSIVATSWPAPERKEFFMHKVGILAAALLLSTTALMAQGIQGVHPDSTPLQVGVGFTFVSFNELPSTTQNNAGLNASAVYYHDYLGAEAQVSDVFGSQNGQTSQNPVRRRRSPPALVALQLDSALDSRRGRLHASVAQAFPGQRLGTRLQSRWRTRLQPAPQPNRLPRLRRHVRQQFLQDLSAQSGNFGGNRSLARPRVTISSR